MSFSLEVRSPQLKVWVLAGGMALVRAWLTAQLSIGELPDSPAQKNSVVLEARFADVLPPLEARKGFGPASKSEP